MRLERYILDEAMTAKNAENFEWMIAQLLYFYSKDKKKPLKILFDESSETLSDNVRDETYFYKKTFVPKYKNSTIKAVQHLLRWKKSFKQICNLGNTVRCMGSGKTKTPGGSPKADLVIDGVGVSVKLSGDIVAASAQGKGNFEQIFTDGLKWFIESEGREPVGESGGDIVKEYKDSIKFIRENLIGEIKRRYVDVSDKKNYEKMFGSAIKKSKDPDKIKKLIDELVNTQTDKIKKLDTTLDGHYKFMQSEIRKTSVKTLNGIFKGPDGTKLKTYIVAEQLTGWNKYKGDIGSATHILSPDGFYQMIDDNGKPNEKLLEEIASRTTFNFRGLPKNRGGKLQQLEKIYNMNQEQRKKAMESFFDMAHGMKADVKKPKKLKESINEGIVDYFVGKVKSYYNKFKSAFNNIFNSIENLFKKEDEYINKEIKTVEDIMNM